MRSAAAAQASSVTSTPSRPPASLPCATCTPCSATAATRWPGGSGTAAWKPANATSRTPAARDVPVAAIGARWGFGDPPHFGQGFKAAVGVTPAEFRRRALA
ncbi:AraC family transcriptional regulator [Amycolatopsis sp. NPDC049688]|uniref:AraC family transcriptional regulator n=1 Tax=Amycolatopsis sp. NPDC049688 TaxID=3154733 RepID=UPI00342B2F45